MHLIKGDKVVQLNSTGEDKFELEVYQKTGSPAPNAWKTLATVEDLDIHNLLRLYKTLGDTILRHASENENPSWWDRFQELMQAMPESYSLHVEEKSDTTEVSLRRYSQLVEGQVDVVAEDWFSGVVVKELPPNLR